ncbi:Gfo/Idh/MocA family oxidoreductase [Oscillatoria laete-virens NRMC-F 0139]|nr:Gfo/Idh/MocA family oxidoreductase [Oscillatoria laete-virens]MDL5053618.1 Gfo/Idh/MocA family oxidoreductase [Oscillatoria laete-virens NRMC-F 0139]
MTLDAFASGRHVLCEKPLGINRAEGREMLAAAKKAGKLLGCCSARVAGSAVTQKVNEFVTGGKLGEVYHATMVIRQTRSRTGIECQPTSRFFLDKSKNGGGPVFDWGPYEFTTMVDALTPSKIEVVHAWMTRPETEIDPKDCVFDIEEHAGATMRFFNGASRPVVVDYERAFCTHGDESNQSPITFQIEGKKGAVKWEWITDGSGRIWHSYDREGKRVTDEITVARADEEHMHSKPIVYFDQAVRGQKSPAYIDETALFNFELLCAVYECVETGKIQTLERK